MVGYEHFDYMNLSASSTPHPSSTHTRCHQRGDSTPDLTGEETAIIFGVLDVYFNEIVVYALMHSKPPNLLCFFRS